MYNIITRGESRGKGGEGVLMVSTRLSFYLVSRVLHSQCYYITTMHAHAITFPLVYGLYPSMVKHTAVMPSHYFDNYHTCNGKLYIMAYSVRYPLYSYYGSRAHPLSSCIWTLKVKNTTHLCSSTSFSFPFQHYTIASRYTHRPEL